MSKITQWEIEVRKIRKMRKCSDKQARKILRKILTAGLRQELERRKNVREQQILIDILIDFVKGEAVNKPLT